MLGLRSRVPQAEGVGARLGHLLPAGVTCRISSDSDSSSRASRPSSFGWSVFRAAPAATGTVLGLSRRRLVRSSITGEGVPVVAGGEIHFELGRAHLEDAREAVEGNGLALEAGQERTDSWRLRLTLEGEEACGALGKPVCAMPTSFSIAPRLEMDLLAASAAGGCGGHADRHDRLRSRLNRAQSCTALGVLRTVVAAPITLALRRRGAPPASQTPAALA